MIFFGPASATTTTAAASAGACPACAWRWVAIHTPIAAIATVPASAIGNHRRLRATGGGGGGASALATGGFARAARLRPLRPAISAAAVVVAGQLRERVVREPGHSPALGAALLRRPVITTRPAAVVPATVVPTIVVARPARPAWVLTLALL